MSATLSRRRKLAKLEATLPQGVQIGSYRSYEPQIAWIARQLIHPDAEVLELLASSRQLGLVPDRSRGHVEGQVLDLLRVVHGIKPVGDKLRPYGAKSAALIRRPLEQDPRIVILHGAVKGGKTYTLHPKILAASASPVRGRRIFVGQDRPTIYRNVLVDLREIVGPANFDYNETSGTVTIYRRKWWLFGARDADAEDAIRGMVVSCAIVDELTKIAPGFFSMLTTRIDPKGAHIYATTNPDSPRHWAKVNYIDNRELADKGELEAVHFDVNDNPNLDEGFKQFLQRSRRGADRDRQVLGRWVPQDGGVFSAYWGDHLLYDRMPAAGIGDSCIAVDPGMVNAFCFTYLVRSGNTIYADDVRYHDTSVAGDKTFNEHFSDLLAFAARHGDCFFVVPTDPLGKALASELRAAGRVVLDANDDVEAGLNWMKQLMALERLKFRRDLPAVALEEVLAYQWDPRKALLGKEVVIKRDDHFVDACRYGVMYLCAGMMLSDLPTPAPVAAEPPAFNPAEIFLEVVR